MQKRTGCRLLAVLAIVAGLLLLAVPTHTRAGADNDGYVPAEVLIKLIDGADVRAVAARNGLNTDPAAINRFGTRPIYRLRIIDGVLPPQKANTLANDSQVVYADPNYIGQTPEGRQQSSWVVGGDSGEYRDQWAPGMIRLPEAHTVTQGAGVIVAVLDTGVDISHPALASRLVSGFDFVDYGPNPSERGNRADFGFGHGTHVAGLVALAAPAARIMPLRVLQPDGSGNLWVLVEALEYAVNNGASVINLSLSFTHESDLLEDLLEEFICDDDDDDDDDRDDDDDDCRAAGGRGVVVVAAAGNTGATTPQYPAAESMDGLLAVAATTQSDTLASFSTRGSWVNIAAPGDDILSTVPGGGYGTWDGTSMASPLVAGTSALVRAGEPGLRASQVAARIISTAAPIQGQQPRRRVDAASAVLAQPRPYRLMLPLVVRSPGN
jgi:subtilisin family serine protease